TAPADTTTRTLKVHVGLWSAQAQFQATLSDGSAANYTETSFVNSSSASNGVYTLSYAAASAGQTLTVRYTVLNDFGVGGNCSLESATLAASSGGGDTQPRTAPTNLSATAAGSSQINLSWTASTDNVGVTGYRVERCQGTGCSNFAQIATPAGTSFNNT